jgi:hypothetical protein
MDTSDDEKKTAPESMHEDSSLTTDSTSPLTLHDSIVHLLANISLDPTIRQAILRSQQTAAKACEES